jgi:hypothetical protein
MTIDTSNLAKVKDGIATREPLPEFIVNSINAFDYPMLADLSWIGLPDYMGWGWWRVEDHSTPLAPYQNYGDEILTPDADRSVVILTRPVIIWDAAQILAYKQSITRHISKQALRARFTQAEKIAFEMAQIDDPNATRDVRVAAASVRVLEKDMNAGAFVDLNGPNTQALIRGLQALGVIAAGRADEIIWDDIAPDEVP